MISLNYYFLCIYFAVWARLFIYLFVWYCESKYFKNITEKMVEKKKSV